MVWVPMCQHCQMLHHKCYSLANKVCGHCQCDKKTCQDMVVEGKSSFQDISVPSSDSLVVYLVPAAHHWVCPMVAPTRARKVAAKGNEVVHLATHLWACKVTWIASPSPKAAISTPPVAGPSGVMCPPLFDKASPLGDEGIGSWGQGAPQVSGE